MVAFRGSRRGGHRIAFLKYLNRVANQVRQVAERAWHVHAVVQSDEVGEDAARPGEGGCFFDAAGRRPGWGEARQVESVSLEILIVAHEGRKEVQAHDRLRQGHLDDLASELLAAGT